MGRLQDRLVKSEDIRGAGLDGLQLDAICREAYREETGPLPAYEDEESAGWAGVFGEVEENGREPVRKRRSTYGDCSEKLRLQRSGGEGHQQRHAAGIKDGRIVSMVTTGWPKTWLRGLYAASWEVAQGLDC